MPQPEEPDTLTMRIHERLFLDVSEEDELLEEYFQSKRTVPTPLELSIYMRQMRANPEFQDRHQRRSFAATSYTRESNSILEK
jgi:hypothetical protein